MPDDIYSKLKGYVAALDPRTVKKRVEEATRKPAELQKSGPTVGLQPGTVPAFTPQTRAYAEPARGAPPKHPRQGKTKVMSSDELVLASRDGSKPLAVNKPLAEGGIPLWAPTRDGRTPINRAATEQDILSKSDDEIQQMLRENKAEERSNSEAVRRAHAKKKPILL